MTKEDRELTAEEKQLLDKFAARDAEIDGLLMKIVDDLKLLREKVKNIDVVRRGVRPERVGDGQVQQDSGAGP